MSVAINYVTTADLSDTDVIIKKKIDWACQPYRPVTGCDIARALVSQGHVVDSRRIMLDEPIKALGVYQVPVKLSAGIVAEVKVWVVADYNDDADARHAQERSEYYKGLYAPYLQTLEGCKELFKGGRRPTTTSPPEAWEAKDRAWEAQFSFVTAMDIAVAVTFKHGWISGGTWEYGAPILPVDYVDGKGARSWETCSEKTRMRWNSRSITLNRPKSGGEITINLDGSVTWPEPNGMPLTQEQKEDVWRHARRIRHNVKVIMGAAAVHINDVEDAWQARAKITGHEGEDLWPEIW